MRLTPKAIEMAKQALDRSAARPTRRCASACAAAAARAFSYVIEFADEAPRDARPRVRVRRRCACVVDPKSLLYLRGSVLDYEKTAHAARLQVPEPEREDAAAAAASRSRSRARSLRRSSWTPSPRWACPGVTTSICARARAALPRAAARAASGSGTRARARRERAHGAADAPSRSTRRTARCKDDRAARRGAARACTAARRRATSQAADPEFLMEMLELREALAEARAAQRPSRACARWRREVAALQSERARPARAALRRARRGRRLGHARRARAALGRAHATSAASSTKCSAHRRGARRADGTARDLRSARRAPTPIGIDLGTTNTLVAYVPPTARRVAHRRLRRRRARAVGRALRAPTGACVVGNAAQAARARAPARHDREREALHGPRRRRPGDAPPRPVPLRAPRRRAACVRFEVARQRVVTPVEVSAEILRALQAARRGRARRPVGGAVITVPAYFDDAQRQATKDAGRLAGPRGAAPAQRADRGGARLRPRQASRTARSPSTTSAAARSTSRSSCSTTACSR